LNEEEEAYDSFAHFGLNPQLIDILKRYNITKPLKIQKIGIPKIINGANTVIAAETGCGKTLTYLLPMIDEVLRWKEFRDTYSGIGVSNRGLYHKRKINFMHL